ncbi:MAG: ABC transporter ATP-binding protein [Pygmaiobacter sp.]
MMRGEKAKDFKGTFRKLIQYLKGYHLPIFIVMVAAALSCVFTIAGPKILAYATNELFSGSISLLTGTGGINFSYIAKVLLTLAVLYCIAAALSYLQGYLMTGVTQRVTFRLREDISKKINRLPLAYFDRTSTGDVLSRVTNDVDTVSQSLHQSLTQIITSITMVVGVLIMMLTISPTMTLVALLVLPLSFLLVGAIVKKSQPLFQKQQRYLGKLNGHVEEMYSGHMVVQAFDRCDESIAEFEQLNEHLYSSAWKSQFLSGLMMPLMSFVGNIGYAAICVLGGYLTVRGHISVGDIQAFIQYVRSFNQPINQIANISNVLQQTAAAAERVFEFLEEVEEIPDPLTPIDPALVEGEVAFAHVKFGYSADKIIINDFSAIIQPGQRVAIVGPTGAGKTTMVKLLMRFYDVSEGAILLDRYDLRQFSRNDLRGLFGMVLQDTWLYHDTIMENIRYGRLDATDDEVIAAAKAAGVHRFIRTLPEGYQSVLTEDADNISQGQKQLLTIARAILSNPKILILDEATSSVDTRTELRIQKAMNTLMEGRTSFVIAHRLSTIRDSDVILVMKDGDIVEVGSHDELIAKNGFYAELYQSQFDPEDTAS